MSQFMVHRTPTTLRHLGALLGAGSLLLAGGGCSAKRGENANLIVGKQEFVAKCGACHTLARASTRGTVGPNLDEAFHASLSEGLRRSAVETVVKGQVENPNRFGVMPANNAPNGFHLSSGGIADVAAYVAQSADRPGRDAGLLATAVQAPGAGKPAVEKGGKLQIATDPSGQLSYVTKGASATAGSVTLEMPNQSGVTHNLALEAGNGGASGSGPVLGATKIISKGVATVNVQLKPGTYTFFCQVLGHRAAGMFGTLTVK
jgi:mono/diheme cytochrome c family protein